MRTMGGATKKQNNPARAQFRRGANVDPTIGPALGEALRAHYAALVNAPVPERFSLLLDKLEAEGEPGRQAQLTPPDLCPGSDERR